MVIAIRGNGSLTTRPGYHLASFDQAASILRNLPEEESDAVKLLFDVFHCQILHGLLDGKKGSCFFLGFFWGGSHEGNDRNSGSAWWCKNLGGEISTVTKLSTESGKWFWLSTPDHTRDILVVS